MASKLPKLETVMNKADGKLTPIVRAMIPCCEACGNPTQVAHHWIEKSRSNYLRYDLRNLIALCQSCHTKIHNLFGSSVTNSLDVAEIIIAKRGKKWRKQLDKDSAVLIKKDVYWAMEQLERLQKLQDEL